MTTPVYSNPAARLRAKLLAQPVAPSRPIEIDGEKFFIRTPLMADRTKVGEIAGLAVKAKKNEATGEVSIDLSQVPMAAMLTAALVVLATDENGNPVCTLADLDALQAAPAGGWVEQLGQACMEALNGEKKESRSATPTAGASPSSSPTV